MIYILIFTLFAHFAWMCMIKASIILPSAEIVPESSLTSDSAIKITKQIIYYILKTCIL